MIVTRFDYSEEANTDLKVNTTIDLSSPKKWYCLCIKIIDGRL